MDKILESIQSPAFWAAVVAAIVSLITLIEHIKSANRDRYLSVVSASRVEWMQNLKKIISEYCCCLENAILDTPNFNQSKMDDLYRYMAKIQLELNFKGVPDNIILKLVLKTNEFWVSYMKDGTDDTQKSDESERAATAVNYILLVSQIYLKVEWERIKFEASYHLVKKFNCNDEFYCLLQDPTVVGNLHSYSANTGFDIYKEYKAMNDNMKRKRRIGMWKLKNQMTK